MVIWSVVAYTNSFNNTAFLHATSCGHNAAERTIFG